MAQDLEFRLHMMVERESITGWALMRIEEDGQLSLVQAVEVAPFDTRLEIVRDLLRSLVSAIPARLVRLR